MSTPPPLPVAPLPDHNPYAAPLAAVDDLPVAALVLADRLTRLLAAIIDGVSVVVVMLPAVFGAAIFSRPGDDGETAMFIMLGVMFLGLVALLGVNLVWLHRYGQTIGKRLLKIKVVRSDGSHCALARIVFARWLPVTLLGAIPLLGYIAQLVDPLMIFRDDRRCLHDLIADTLVVQA